MMQRQPKFQAELEGRLSRLGYDLVQLQLAGSVRRPVIRIRVERAALDRPVSVGDCASVSRHLESWLDGSSEVPERYMLEVSSPGVERPLTRGRDFKRFRGRRIFVEGSDVLCGRAARMEGELLGLADEEGEGAGSILLRLNGGDEVEIPRTRVKAARLVYEGGT